MTDHATASKLPGTREELMQLHAEARKARAAAELGSEAFREAVEELARIEVQVARIERHMDPPRV